MLRILTDGPLYTQLLIGAKERLVKFFWRTCAIWEFGTTAYEKHYVILNEFVKMFNSDGIFVVKI